MKYIALFIFLFGLYTTPYAQKSVSVHDVLSGLPGTWHNQQTGSFERWDKDGENYKGYVFTMAGTDTMVQEYSAIYTIKGTWFFEATVPNQNNGLPVLFKLKKVSAGKLVFENRKHDFPQVITYQWVEKGHILASIEAGKGKKLQQYQFHLYYMSK